MSRIRRIWAGWVRLLDRREPGESLALFRVAVGVVVLWTLLEAVLGGIVGTIWVDRAHGGYRDLGSGPYLVRWLGGPTPRVIWAMVLANLAGGGLLVLGLGGRLTAFATLQAYIAVHRLNGHASGSSDILVTNALWLLVLSRSTATLSLDCLLRTGRLRSDEEIPAFPRYLGVLQLVVLYWSTGLQKVSAYWFPAGYYSALYYIMQQPTWQRFDMTWLAHVYPLTQFATAMTWLWEVTAPLLLVVLYLRYTGDRGGRLRRWANRFDLRKPWVAVGVMLHVMILIAMDVGHFSQITFAFYLCLCRPEELRAAGAWFRGGRREPAGAGGAERVRARPGAPRGTRDVVEISTTTERESQDPDGDPT